MNKEILCSQFSWLWLKSDEHCSVNPNNVDQKTSQIGQSPRHNWISFCILWWTFSQTRVLLFSRRPRCLENSHTSLKLYRDITFHRSFRISIQRTYFFISRTAPIPIPKSYPSLNELIRINYPSTVLNKNNNSKQIDTQFTNKRTRFSEPA